MFTTEVMDDNSTTKITDHGVSWWITWIHQEQQFITKHKEIGAKMLNRAKW